jgi:hypothetical protein
MRVQPTAALLRAEHSGGYWHDHGTWDADAAQCQGPHRHTAQVELEFGDLAR